MGVKPKNRPVAILLNRNAKRVSPAVVRALDGLDGFKLFVSRDFDDARDISERVVRDGYETILVGGGDGTFVEWTSDITRRSELAGQVAPRFGVLPLGTGNALACTLGAPSVTAKSLRAGLRHTIDSAVERPLPFLEVEGKLTPFAGFGLDAQILEDHHAVETALRLRGVRISANAGYALSVIARSIPRFALTPAFQITIVNAGEPALVLGPDGSAVGDPVPMGDVIHQGRAVLATCATIPFVGLRMRLFPFTDRHRGRFSLRVAECGLAEILGNLPSLWRGAYRSERIYDYACTRIVMEVDHPLPFQIGGDCAGRHERVLVEMADRPVRVLA